MCNYASITAPLEKLLKKEAQFVWKDNCQVAFDYLKEKLVSMKILIFPDCNQISHVHVDASSFMLNTILMQSREEDLKHPIAFSIHKLSNT